tara:strand:- start:887 stop:3907 length:3021 start_codon:yes stop_codon:yes gene_type:complete
MSTFNFQSRGLAGSSLHSSASSGETSLRVRGVALAFISILIALTASASDKKHWSFQPVKRAVVPAQSNPIDYFIDRTLRENNLKPSPKADRITLLRRASLDLTGLPPSPEAVKSFVDDPRKTNIAFAEAVNGLLASPRYGERWAQHWLDVVRYADTHGFEVNTPRPHAWPYRDYVIEAFNKDTPFDQFIREQIAGDQIGQDAATGFLMTAARLLPGQIGKDAESMRLARQDELGEIVINTSEAFLGLSVGCARCHDHKFDDISAKDYYSMQAFFAGVSYGDRPIRPANAGALHKEKEQLQSRVREIDRALAGFVPLARSGVERSSVNASLNVERFAPVKARKVRFTIKKTNLYEPCIDELEIFDTNGQNIALASLGVKRSASGSKVSGKHKLEFINDGQLGNSRSWMCGKQTGWVMLEFPAVHTIDRLVWSRDREGKFTDRLALEYVIEVADDLGVWKVVAVSTDRRSLIKIVNGIVRPGPERQGTTGFKNAYDGDVGTMTFTTNPGTTTAPQRSLLAFEKGVHNLSHIRINDIAGNDKNGRLQQITVRVTTDTDADLAARTYSDVKNLSIEMFSGDANPLPKVKIKGNTIEHLDTAHDGFYSIVFDPVPGATGIELEWKNEGNFKHWTLREIEACSGAPNKTQKRKSIAALEPKQLAKSKALLVEKKKIESRLTEISKSRLVFGGKFGKPETVHLLKRGDAEQPQEEVTPTVLSALGELSLAKDAPEADRRLALANWIANAKNPLTARVAVNRIWQFHFGAGLVLTSSDFGRNGAKPSHPELLDWLAHEFVRSGWSVKHMHKLIMLSDTYQQSSRMNEAGQKADADSRLLWRFPSRRLEAEAIRDSILLVSGNLNLEAGGPGFSFFKSRGGLTGFPPVTEFTPREFRRMIYQHKIRMEPVPIFGVFDAPDAGQTMPRRKQSTTAIQALNLFNSPFVNDQAAAFANRVVKETGNDSRQQVTRAFQLAFGRQPNPVETKAAVATAETHGLPTLCRVLFNSNEFLFIP